MSAIDHDHAMHDLVESLGFTQLLQLQTRIRRKLRSAHCWFDAARPDWDTYFSLIAHAVALRGSCARRRVGAVAVSQDHQTLSTAYNGKAAGLVNCLDEPCLGAGGHSGQGLESCEGIHAEINAVIRCANWKDIHTVYVTCSPCANCIDVLLGTACQRIVFTEHYPNWQESHRRWTQAGREWVFLSLPGHTPCTIAGCACS